MNTNVDALSIEHLTSERWKILVIEGHIDLQAAQAAISAEGYTDYPMPSHQWMRYAQPPEDEPEFDADSWREVCKPEAVGAAPVTISIKQY